MVDKLQLLVDNHPLVRAGKTLAEIRGRIFPYTNVRTDIYWPLLDWKRFNKTLVFGDEGKVDELIQKNKKITLENVSQLLGEKKEDCGKRGDLSPFEFITLQIRYWLALAIINVFLDKEIVPLMLNYMTCVSQEAIRQSSATTAIVLEDRLRQNWDRLSQDGYGGDIRQEISDFYVNRELCETVRTQVDSRWELLKGLGVNGKDGRQAFFADAIHDSIY